MCKVLVYRAVRERERVRKRKPERVRERGGQTDDRGDYTPSCLSKWQTHAIGRGGARVSNVPAGLRWPTAEPREPWTFPAQP